MHFPNEVCEDLDCLISHGASALMQERLLYKSDAYRLLVCSACGRTTYHDGKDCRHCSKKGKNGPESMVGVVVPYHRCASARFPLHKHSAVSFKLLLQEMAAMGIDVQISTGDADR